MSCITRATVVVTLLSAMVPRPSASQSAGKGPSLHEALRVLEVWADAQREYQQIPAVSMGIVHGQDLVWGRGFGFAHREERVAATTETLYSICSITKLFTSIGVMQLRDMGKLRLDDPIETHLPWIDIEQTYPGAPPITVEGLLTHASGLPREPDIPYWTETDFDFPTREQILAQLPGQETLYPAFERWQYSNLGLILAGEVVAAASGRPWGDYMDQSILGPLGMGDTYTEIPKEHQGGRLATGYGALTREGMRNPMAPFLAKGVRPAFGFASNVEDLARFASWQFRLLETGVGEVLEANTLREMHRVHFTDFETTWGLGFSVQRRDDETFVGHGGSCPGHRTDVTLHPKSQIAVITLINASGADPGHYSQRAFEIMAPAIEGGRAGEGSAGRVDPALEAYLGNYRSPLGGETEIVMWEGGLAALSLPTDDPLGALSKLRPEGEHVFRRVRNDGELAEPWLFEMEGGRAVRIKRHQNYVFRAR